VGHVKRNVMPMMRARGVNVSHFESAAETLDSCHNNGHNNDSNGNTLLCKSSMETVSSSLFGGTSVGQLLSGFSLGGELDTLAKSEVAVPPQRLAKALAAAREELADLCVFSALAARDLTQRQQLLYATRSAPLSRSSSDSSDGVAGDTESMSSCGDIPDDLLWCMPLGIAEVDAAEFSACFGGNVAGDAAVMAQYAPRPVTPPDGEYELSMTSNHSRPKEMVPLQRKKARTASSHRQRLGSNTEAPAMAVPSPCKTPTALSATAGKKTAPRSQQKAVNRHQCLHCEKFLDTKYKLERHVRTHTGEKPFKCEMCPARFNQKSSLKTHSTIHAKAVLRDPSTTKTMIERYAVNGYTFEAMGIPYAGFVYDAIHKQRSGTHA
jgi:hypothetical protein